MAKPVDICIFYTRGDECGIPFTVKDKDGNAVNISGFSFTLTVDPDPAPNDDTNNLMQLTGIITDAANGKVEFRPTSVESDFTPESYFHDIQIVDGAGRKCTVAAGQFTLLQDITKT